MNRWTEQEAQERSPEWFKGVDPGVVVATGHCPITTGFSWQAWPPTSPASPNHKWCLLLEAFWIPPCCNDWFPLRRASPNQYCGNIITCFHGWGLRLTHTPEAGQGGGGGGGGGGREVAARLHLLRAWVGTSQADSSRLLSPSFCSYPSATPAPVPLASSPAPPFPVRTQAPPLSSGAGLGGFYLGSP